jgi:hypothetical protein
MTPEVDPQTDPQAGSLRGSQDLGFFLSRKPVERFPPRDDFFTADQIRLVRFAERPAFVPNRKPFSRFERNLPVR